MLRSAPTRTAELQAMLEDVQQALKKPVNQRSWIMVINTKKCSGCHSCAVACMAENMSPPTVTYRAVPEVEIGEYPQVSRVFMPTNCMHCDNPPCAKAANAITPGAINKQPDGIVTIAYDKFRDKKAFDAAAKACPYKALYWDDGAFFTKGLPIFEPYEQQAGFEYGERLKRTEGKAPAGSGRKCHFCLHRLNAGMIPACVTTCPCGAMYFGDKNNSKGLAMQLLAFNNGIRLKVSQDTRPRVYYLTSETGTADNLKACLACHGA